MTIKRRDPETIGFLEKLFMGSPATDIPLSIAPGGMAVGPTKRGLSLVGSTAGDVAKKASLDRLPAQTRAMLLEIIRAFKGDTSEFVRRRAPQIADELMGATRTTADDLPVNKNVMDEVAARLEDANAFAPEIPPAPAGPASTVASGQTSYDLLKRVGSLQNSGRTLTELERRSLTKEFDRAWATARTPEDFRRLTALMNTYSDLID